MRRTTHCPRCRGSTRRSFLRQHGVCGECRRDQGPRELHGPERDAAIGAFMTWLAGRMPSEAMRATDRAPDEVAAERLRWLDRVTLSHGRTRPETRRL